MKYRKMVVPPTQRERADERQVVNNAGGYVYEVDKAARLRRFLVLGTEGGTFYVTQAALTRENTTFLEQYATEEPIPYFAILREANEGNITPRHSTVLFALAVLWAKTPNMEVRAAIEEGFTTFVRTATHLFEFLSYVTMFRGWSRALRRLVGSWYKAKEPRALAYQVVKYRQRSGWTHRDVLRQAHPKVDESRRGVIDYAVHGFPKTGTGFAVIDQFEAVSNGSLTAKAADALPWEALPTDTLTDPLVWQALVKGGRLPIGAMIRNLGRMTANGALLDADTMGMVLRTLGDEEAIAHGRIHPFQALTALKTYQSGGGFRGNLTWTPKRQVIDALDAMFYKAFGAVQPTGKRLLVALDVSGSMVTPLMNSNVTAREGSAAMALATIAADPDTTDVVGFTQDGWSLGGRSRLGGWASTIEEMDISPRQRMDDVIRTIRSKRMGGTDCSLPMLWAYETRRVYDAFVIYTDNETWGGKVQPMEALRQYRKDINPGARLIVVGMTSTGFTIADPTDTGALDVVGFDASAPSLIANFVAGRF